jgi:hypothetical protein
MVWKDRVTWLTKFKRIPSVLQVILAQIWIELSKFCQLNLRLELIPQKTMMMNKRVIMLNTKTNT